MKIDIRQNIVNNFKGSNVDEMKHSIEDSIQAKKEITLPGLGVFFEILWGQSSADEKNMILDHILKGL